MDLEKPKISSLIASKVVVDFATLKLWCHGSNFGVATLNFACPYNVVALNVNVATML